MKFWRSSTNHKKEVAESKIGLFKLWVNSNNTNNKGFGIRNKLKFKRMPSSNPNDKKSVMDEILGDLSKSSAAKQVVLGTASGWLTGFVTMKIGKVAALAVGGGILILQIAHHKGYIKVNWDKLQKSADKIADRIEKEATGKEPNMMDKFSRYVDRKLDKAEEVLKSKERKARKWYHSFINNNGHGGYELQELHLFIASFAAGLTFGFATA